MFSIHLLYLLFKNEDILNYCLIKKGVLKIPLQEYVI